ncbi:unnamed protein product [Cuscuta campestris]|uniref:Uncharacterized protein n=1 Tax=Cuscuta campestris TaxID=132261 RepID=A0A484N1U0_9ASTE|nr:unnamed protein product [Cuscuta campestris]
MVDARWWPVPNIAGIFDSSSAIDGGGDGKRGLMATRATQATASHRSGGGGRRDHRTCSSSVAEAPDNISGRALIGESVSELIGDLDPPARRAVGGIGSDEQVVAPVRGVGEAAAEGVVMGRPLLLEGVDQIWD